MLVYKLRQTQCAWDTSATVYKRFPHCLALTAKKNHNSTQLSTADRVYGRSCPENMKCRRQSPKRAGSPCLGRFPVLKTSQSIAIRQSPVAQALQRTKRTSTWTCFGTLLSQWSFWRSCKLIASRQPSWSAPAWLPRILRLSAPTRSGRPWSPARGSLTCTKSSRRGG